MPIDQCSEYFSEEILKGLIARIGLPAYGVLSVIAAAGSNVGEPVRMPIERIAELMGKSVETARSGLDVLKQYKLVTVELRGRSNVYWVNFFQSNR